MLDFSLRSSGGKWSIEATFRLPFVDIPDKGTELALIEAKERSLMDQL